MAERMRLHFSGFTFDGETRELRRGDDRVPLTPRAYQLLTLLLECRPRPVPQTRLRDALWPDACVGYTSLAQVVTEVRKALGDAATAARFVRTVPRFGYAFVAPVVEEQPVQPPFVGSFVADQREFLIAAGESLVGRGTECAVRLPSARVSRVHARVRAVGGGQVAIEDAGSKNGTWVNGRRCAGPIVLADGDEVGFGTFRVTFRRLGASDPTRTGQPASP